LLLDGIQSPSKQQGVGQRQTDLFRECLHVPLQSRKSQGSQFVQQFQQCLDLVLPLGTVQYEVSVRDHDFQHAVQFLAERTHSLRHRRHLSQQHFLLAQGGLRTSAASALALSRLFGLPLDHLQTLVFGFERTIQAPLNLGSQREEMPHIALMARFSFYLAQRLLDGSTSITDRPHPADPLFLHIPQHHCPTVSIDCSG
jgi:hypothetical protein